MNLDVIGTALLYNVQHSWSRHVVPSAAGGNTAVSAEFDELMAASATYFQSRGEKCDLEDVAIAAEEVCFAAAGEDTAVAASLLNGGDAMN